ncbi:transposase [Nocardioides cynanchi]|uniref:transposase n=1 Tax=Nocardioides cynanchi TaxID=2558918 RepID=UPI00124519BF|nr:transposase [Nocardioides cynanchi]
MYTRRAREAALAALAAGETAAEVSRRLGVARSTLRAWTRDPQGRAEDDDCPGCSGCAVDGSAYAALLGFYLGDGCLSAAARYVVFRVSCDASYPRVVDDVTHLITLVRPGSKVFHVTAPGTVVVQSHWKHWPCLFPQHGPGRKHERPIVLEPWQRQVVAAHPGDFLRGLFHSDGSRTANWARRTVQGQPRRYDYPRWEFVNHSADILGLCTWALDLCEIRWRRPRPVCVAVSRRDDVRRLDELIGPKA